MIPYLLLLTRQALIHLAIMTLWYKKIFHASCQGTWSSVVKQKALNRPVHDLVDSRILPTYLSIAPSGLPLTLAVPGQAILLELTRVRWNRVRQSRSQTQCSILWSWNETTSAHAHIIIEPVLSYGCWTRRKKEYKKWHFCNRTLLCLAVFHVAFGHLYESCWYKGTQRGRLAA